MLSTLAGLLALGAVFVTLTVAIVFANKFAVLCLSMLTAYLGTLLFLAVRGRQQAAANSNVVMMDPEYRRPSREDQQMMLRRIS